MDMLYRSQFYRYQVEGAVPDPGFGGKFIAETVDMLGRAAQKQGFQAIIMIQMHMHGRHNQIMRFVLDIGQAFGQIAFMVVIDIGKCRHAVHCLVLVYTFTLNFFAQQVANGFGAVGVATGFYPLIELGRQIIA